MVLKIFAIHDSKAASFMQPFFFPETGMAIRAFMELCCDPTHQFCKHPADFTLFYIGDFDQKDGMLAPSSPQTLGNGVQFKKAEG